MLRAIPREVKNSIKFKTFETMKNKQLRIKRKWEKSGLKISKQLRDIIHGYIMSDGYVNQRGILTIDQGKKQEKFVLWLESELKQIQSGPIKEQIRVHPQTQKKTVSLRFSTKAVLHGFHAMWYQPYQKDGSIRYKKKLPNSVRCFFNEQSIAVWFAGDGTKIVGSKGAKFEVTAFSVSERLALKKAFLTKFGIRTLIIKSGTSKKGRTQWVLKIPAQSYASFRDLITQTELIPNLFSYKLHKK